MTDSRTGRRKYYRMGLVHLTVQKNAQKTKQIKKKTYNNGGKSKNTGANEKTFQWSKFKNFE